MLASLQDFTTRKLIAALLALLAIEVFVAAGAWLYSDIFYPTEPIVVHANLDAVSERHGFDTKAALENGYNKLEISEHLAERNSSRNGALMQKVLVAEGAVLSVAVLLLGAVILLRPAAVPALVASPPPAQIWQEGSGPEPAEEEKAVASARAPALDATSIATPISNTPSFVSRHPFAIPIGAWFTLPLVLASVGNSQVGKYSATSLVVMTAVLVVGFAIAWIARKLRPGRFPNAYLWAGCIACAFGIKWILLALTAMAG